MDLVGKLVGKVLESKMGGGESHSSEQQQPEYSQPQPSYGGGSYEQGGYSSAPPPGPGQDLPYPWVARFDDGSGRWYFVNEQTGERTWERPGHGGPPQGYGQQPSYGGGYEGGGGYNSGYGGGYGGERQGEYYPQEQEKPKKDHSMMYGVGGVLLGAGAGALAMHEGEKIHDGFEEKKESFEEGVKDFPENAAEWTGEKVGEVEEFPDRVEDGFDRFGDNVENKWDNAVDNVEEFPENAAEWTGEKVGAVEQFGDDMGDAYDEGKEEGRYEEEYE